MRELLSGSFSFYFTLVSFYKSLKDFYFDWNCLPLLISIQKIRKSMMKLKYFEAAHSEQGHETVLYAF